MSLERLKHCARANDPEREIVTLFEMKCSVHISVGLMNWDRAFDDLSFVEAMVKAKILDRS